MESITELKVARDIDLLKGNKKIDVVAIVVTHKMTSSNYQVIVGSAFDCGTRPYNEIASQYLCDICKTQTSEGNPIWTNPKYQGVDICNQCMASVIRSGKLVCEEGFHLLKID